MTTPSSSNPFIINVVNPTNDMIYNIKLFDSIYSLNSNELLKENKFISDNVEISSKTSISYREYLLFVMKHPVVFDCINIFCKNAEQLMSIYCIEQLDKNGIKAIKELPNIQSPYPPYYINNTRKCDFPFIIDGFTSLTIDKVYPQTEITFSLFKKQ